MPEPLPSARRLLGLAVLAVLVTALVGGLWSALLVANLALSPGLPWSVAVMAAVLAAMWRVVGGQWGPSTGRAERARMLRANPVGGRALALVLAGGLLALVALVGLWVVLVQAGGVAARTLPNSSTYPAATVVSVVVMASLVGAFVEEAMFRGYLQGSLQRVVSPAAAIAITCAVMAPEHGVTQGFLWTTVVFYLAVDVVLGVMAVLTDSILPGIFVHAVGLVVFFGFVWPADAGRTPLAQGGADVVFWLHLAQAVVFGVLAALVFARVPKAGGEPEPERTAGRAA